MNGLLAFSIGLQTGNFLGPLSGVQRGMTSLLGTAASFAGVGSAIEGFFAAISRGADLQRLHARTGESVQDLFLLEKGFKRAGLSAEDVAPMLFHLQKGLAGLNDMGEETASAFAVLGLSMQGLRAMNGPQQFAAIGTALTRLNRDQAALVASKIFGREGAANFLQLANSSKQFSAALMDNAAAAQQIAKNAAAFQQIEISIGQIKSKGENLFAGIAAGAAPGLQAALDALNKIDLTELGQKFGTVIAGFGEAIKEGKLGELLELSLEAGMQGFENYFTALVAGMDAAMQKFFQNIIEHTKNLPNFLMGVEQMAAGALDAATGGGAKGYDLYRYGKSRAGLEKPLEGTGDAFAKALAASLKSAPHAAIDAFNALITTLANKASKDLLSKYGVDGTLGNGASTAGTVKPWEATAFEKMGFHFFGGGPTILADHARATSTNTQRTAAACERIAAAMGLKGLTPVGGSMMF